MKKFFLLCFLFVSSFAFSQLKLPPASQSATVTQTIGFAKVTINYSRPNVKGREIWGKLVPYNVIWRAGANFSTEFNFSEDVTIAGKTLAAGSYSFFILPQENEWTIIFNKVVKQWGPYTYDSLNNVLEFTVNPSDNNFTESLEYTFSQINHNRATVNLSWENKRISFPVEVNIETGYDYIKNVLDSAEQHNDYSMHTQAALWCFDNNLYLDEGSLWIDKAIMNDSSSFTLFVKSRYEAKRGDFTIAIQTLKKAIQIGLEETNGNFSFEDNFNGLIKRWEKGISQ